MSRILLLEDDPDTGEAICAMLAALGHSADWVRNGQEAIVHIQAHPAPDLVLTDILMPGMDGLEAIQHLRVALSEVPIIAMSAQVNAPYLQAAAVFGARVTLPKPFTLEVLKAAIAKVMGG